MGIKAGRNHNQFGFVFLELGHPNFVHGSTKCYSLRAFRERSVNGVGRCMMDMGIGEKCLLETVQN